MKCIPPSPLKPVYHIFFGNMNLDLTVIPEASRWNRFSLYADLPKDCESERRWTQVFIYLKKGERESCMKLKGIQVRLLESDSIYSSYISDLR